MSRCSCSSVHAPFRARTRHGREKISIIAQMSAAGSPNSRRGGLIGGQRLKSFSALVGSRRKTAHEEVNMSADSQAKPDQRTEQRARSVRKDSVCPWSDFSRGLPVSGIGQTNGVRRSVGRRLSVRRSSHAAGCSSKPAACPARPGAVPTIRAGPPACGTDWRRRPTDPPAKLSKISRNLSRRLPLYWMKAALGGAFQPATLKCMAPLERLVEF